MTQVLMLAPASGAKLLLTDGAYDDQGSAYAFEMILKPVWAEGKYGQWQAFGFEVRYNSAFTMTVTPIVDGVQLDAQAYTISVGTPTGWARTVEEGRMQAWGKKATLKIEVQSDEAGQFYLEGAYFDVRVQQKHAPK